MPPETSRAVDSKGAIPDGIGYQDAAGGQRNPCVDGQGDGVIRHFTETGDGRIAGEGRRPYGNSRCFKRRIAGKAAAGGDGVGDRSDPGIGGILTGPARVADGGIGHAVGEQDLAGRARGGQHAVGDGGRAGGQRDAQRAARAAGDGAEVERERIGGRVVREGDGGAARVERGGAGAGLAVRRGRLAGQVQRAAAQDQGRTAADDIGSGCGDCREIQLQRPRVDGRSAGVGVGAGKNQRPGVDGRRAGVGVFGGEGPGAGAVLGQGASVGTDNAGNAAGGIGAVEGEAEAGAGDGAGVGKNEVTAAGDDAAGTAEGEQAAVGSGRGRGVGQRAAVGDAGAIESEGFGGAEAEPVEVECRAGGDDGPRRGGPERSVGGVARRAEFENAAVDRGEPGIGVEAGEGEGARTGLGEAARTANSAEGHRVVYQGVAGSADGEQEAGVVHRTGFDLEQAVIIVRPALCRTQDDRTDDGNSSGTRVHRDAVIERDGLRGRAERVSAGERIKG